MKTFYKIGLIGIIAVVIIVGYKVLSIKETINNNSKLSSITDALSNLDISNSDAPISLDSNNNTSWTIEEPSSQTNNIEPIASDSNRKILDLSGKGLLKVPSEVFSMESLEELNLSNNKLSGALPAEIRKLKSLRILRAENNQMTGLPAEIGQLTKLEVIDVSGNQLIGLPYELANLKNLKSFDLAGNNYSKLDFEIISKEMPNTTFIIN